ncbi:nucleoside-diphosphate-sugar epimerase [Trichoderma velutinum]
MKILITGAGGFVGQVLAQELLQNTTNKLILTDTVDITLPKELPNYENATVIKADLLIESHKVVHDDLDVVCILHGIMSSGAEANFDLGFKVNVDATRNLLDCIKNANPHIRTIYASSIAVYGRPFPERITEGVLATPEGAYGCEKLICETMINEYTRRGFLDGFVLRLPGITVRPGPPAQAASSFLSGIIREPLAGRKCVVPTKDRSKEFWVCSPKILVRNLIHMFNLPSSVLPLHRRVINAPGSLVSIQQMRDALAKIGGPERLDYIEEAENTSFDDLVQSWPCNFDVSLALGLGMCPAESFEMAVQEYVASYHSV